MKKSFTLIEMIVVVGVIGLTLPIFFTIILSILQQQTRIYALQEIKRQGDSIVASMNNTIKNSAMEIYSDQALTAVNIQCSLAGSSYSSATGTDFYFKDRLGNWYNFYLDGTNVATGSALTLGLLNNDKVTISNFDIGCSRQSAYASSIVSISFTVNYGTTTTSLNYKTKAKLRSY